MTAAALEWKARGLLALGLVMMLAVVATGMAGHGLAGFALAAGGLAGARLLARPWLLTRLRETGGPGRLMADLGGQVALALGLFWLGVVLALGTGWQPALPLAAPVAVIVAASGLSRRLWRPVPPETDAFLTEATEAVTRAASAWDDIPDEAQVEAAQAVMAAALDALPQTGATERAIADVVLPHMVAMPWYDYRNMLFDRAGALETDRDIRALVIGLTDPFIATKTEGEADLDAAFQLVERQGGPAALDCFARLSLALLALFADSWRDLPPPDRLRARARDAGSPAAAALRALADRIETLASEDKPA